MHSGDLGEGWLAQCDRRNCRSCSSLNLQRLHDEGKLVGSPPREVVQFQVFQQMNAPLHQQHLMHGLIQLWIGIWHDFNRAGVASDEQRILFCQPFRCSDSDPGRRPKIPGVVLLP